MLHPASLHAKAPAVFRARFTTTKGPFVVTVHRKWAPRGADRFYNLVRAGFYDRQRLFRVVPGFVVQWGINGTPKISKAWQNATLGYWLDAERNGRGTNRPGSILRSSSTRVRSPGSGRKRHSPPKSRKSPPRYSLEIRWGAK